MCRQNSDFPSSATFLTQVGSGVRMSSPAQLAVLSALGSSAITSLGWSWLPPSVSQTVPWCRAAASFLETALAKERTPCACEEADARIEKVIEELRLALPGVVPPVKEEAEELVGVRRLAVDVARAGPWMLELALAIGAALSVAAVRAVGEVMRWCCGVRRAPRPMRAIRRRVA